MIVRRALFAVFTLTLAACATGGGVDQRPLTSGTWRDFEADFARVSAATDQSIAAAPITVQGARMEGTSRVINFTKPVSAFSWGEVGRVVITPVDADTTRIYVDSEKRSQVQITGTSEDQFAARIFGGVESALAR